MGSFWSNKGVEYKSPLRVAAQFLFRSRETKAQKCRELKQQLDEAKREITRLEAEALQRSEEIRELQQQAQRLEDENRKLAGTQCILPDDPPLKGHKYGRRMIALAVNLVRAIGLRGSKRVLTTVWEWLGVEQPIPDWTTIRMWLLRVGLAAQQEPIERADDWIWMADHSNQIGPEKALVVLGVRASQLPPPGETLQHEDVHLLTVRPGTAWKREDMGVVYRELAEQYGVPRAVLCDGAVELRDGAKCLKTQREDTIVLQDFKHKAATFLQATVGNHPRFAEFTTQVGKSRATIQQTELAHLTPPGKKPKARFMNLGATLDWAATVLWLLDHPQAEARKLVATERLEEKLGWLRSFAPQLAEWRECQQVIDAGVKFINEQGLFCGAGAQLRAAMSTNQMHAAGQQLAERLIDFVTASEVQLKEGERLPMSTEILESTFALYKQLERQHSKGGFTSLLAGFGALLKKATAETVTRAFTAVSVADVQQWIRKNLGSTLTSKRLATYKEFKSVTKAPATS